MKNARRITDNPYLVNEILEGIFLRLPVKTLLRLKCLCKRYCDLISSPWFITLHRKIFNSEPYNHCILVQNGEINRLIRIRNPGCLIKLNEPCTSNYTVVGSINGLVCLVTTTGSRKLIFLWNPSINQFKMFPPKYNMNRQMTRYMDVSMGFGYEKDSDDYKVMRVLSYKTGWPSTTLLEVYSTKLESWTVWNFDVHLKMSTCRCDVIVEGFTYWVAKDLDGSTVLVSCDLSSDDLILIPVWESLITESQSFEATNYLGSLALLVYSSPSEFKACLEVWMFEDVSAEAFRWQKKFTFRMDFEFSRHWGLTGGDIVVKNAPNMPFLFNLTTKQMRVIGINPILSLFNYTESLVSIEGFKRIRNQQKVRRRRNASIPQKNQQDRANRHIAEFGDLNV
ncbi:hypothetical protein R3W88_005516 [Solanum pinnatisectum]|uniref:F-box domain-containing protein n=1 Tax=Solanum pinnatisectum TaxID=50273 RepID=A0AAV9KD20_9SOLN|nr:hypothetical protein R3W88_005516 [Solanum pinnatisectum]